jgi:hypothetical protein
VSFNKEGIGCQAKWQSTPPVAEFGPHGPMAECLKPCQGRPKTN